MVVPAHALQAVQFRFKSLSLMKGSLLFRTKHFFVCVSPCFAVGSLSNTTWYSQRMLYKRCKLSWCGSVMKGTLLLRSKQFFVPISPRIAVGSLSNTTFYSLRMRYKQSQLGWSRSVMKGILLLRRNNFSFVSGLKFRWDHWVIPHGTHCAFAAISSSFVEIG
jgi:hypothetical protein